MGAGLIQLSAYGSQDIYLTGNPQITFFKIVYRRHTNFSMEIAEQSISGTPSNGGISDIKTLASSLDASGASLNRHLDVSER